MSKSVDVGRLVPWVDGGAIAARARAPDRAPSIQRRVAQRRTRHSRVHPRGRSRRSVRHTCRSGRQTDVQPGLLIITKRHYSRTTDIAVQPRPSDRLCDASAADRSRSCRRGWGPFAANAGTYELSGDMVTLRALVFEGASRPGRRAASRGCRVELEGNALSLTPIENSPRPQSRPASRRRYVRVE